MSSEKEKKGLRENRAELHYNKFSIVADLYVDKSGKIIEKTPFTYLEYLEFSSAEEFERFKNSEPITSDEIETINWEELAEKLEGAA